MKFLYLTRGKLVPVFLTAALLILGVSAAPLTVFMDQTTPDLSVWYGDNQKLGHPGLAQRWVNILGNAVDPQSSVTKLSYRLNGSSPVLARLGPDNRRLQRRGDFNLELDPESLTIGKNHIQIEATNVRGLTTTREVTFQYSPQPVALPYFVDWAKVTDVQDVLQVVDGYWQWDSTGIHPVQTGYDRMLAVGDRDWTNYQVTVPVTFHGVSSQAWGHKEGGKHGGISIDLRWIGHSKDPRDCPPPNCGWNPVGNFSKYFIQQDGQDYLALKVKEKEPGHPSLSYKIERGHTYIFKTAVMTTEKGNEYFFKVWEPGREPEPSSWMLINIDDPGPNGDGNPFYGGFSLVAHYADVTFGNILVEPLP